MCEVSFFLFIIGVIGRKEFLRQDRFVTYMKDHHCLYLAARTKDVESPSSFTFSDFMFTSAPYSIWIKVRKISSPTGQSSHVGKLLKVISKMPITYISYETKCKDFDKETRRLRIVVFDLYARESVRDGRCMGISVSSMRHSGAKTIQYDPLAYHHVKLLHTVKRKEVG